MVMESACSKSSAYNSSPPAQPVVKEITLQSNNTLGNYLVDKDGRTLYFFVNDADGKNHCTGPCELKWPVFNVDNINADKLGAGLSNADFGQITLASGSKQVTYKGWPLYHFAPPTNGANVPEAPGQTSGDNASGLFFVGKPDYTIMIVRDQLVGHDGKNYKSNFTEGDEVTTYFTDGKGATLYTFSLDGPNKNNWTTPDFSNNSIWPIYETDKIVVPSALDKTLFGSITVFGKKQLTYKGWPLYNFGVDGNVRGANKGISFPQPGVWPVASTSIPVAQ
jgi:predicted lipoprotein with Yx(FWY)xxD motif